MAMNVLVFIARLYIVLALWLPALIGYSIAAGIAWLWCGLKPRPQQG